MHRQVFADDDHYMTHTDRAAALGGPETVSLFGTDPWQLISTVFPAKVSRCDARTSYSTPVGSARHASKREWNQTMSRGFGFRWTRCNTSTEWSWARGC